MELVWKKNYVNHNIMQTSLPVLTNDNTITYVDQMIQQALQRSVSDIHIEPYQDYCRLRYRQDGILYEITHCSNEMALRLITRLKILAKLDIAERRLPQDGRFRYQNCDIRISSCPILFGEKMVLRLMDTKQSLLDINLLGLTEKQKKLFLEKISQPQGLILVTGPTGSGKTITLYSALHHLNQTEKNISTIEDPIEIQLSGINQTLVSMKSGLHFANTLRALLRQDPDIIMVGEIRDTETAEIAVQAAQTGHLVLSTLHTTSAIETVSRLQSMTISPYDIISSISLIVAQRLVRKLCPHCKKRETISVDNTMHSIFRANGCNACLQGYRGRIGIYECLAITEKIVDLILMRANSFSLVEELKKTGFMSLQESGLQKVVDGITSMAEMNRVLCHSDRSEIAALCHSHS